MPDLTRFDFHAVRFMNSEDVEEMTADEVGQYILLLCKAWLMGKETTLPTDIEKLSRYARTDQVSENVLKHFPIVETEWGQRRRNSVLYGEWMDACVRSDNGKTKARARWDKTPLTVENDATADATASAPAHASAMQGPMPGSTRTRPIQTDSDQSGPTQTSDGQGGFRFFKRHFKELVGANLSGDKRTQGDYAKYSQQYGEEILLECLEEWAKKSGEWARTAKCPAFAFWKVLPEYAETAMDVLIAKREEEAAQKEKEDKKAQEEKNIQASIARQIAEHQKDLDARTIEENLGEEM